MDPRVRRSDCRSSCAKNHAVPALFACKRALSASACCGRFAGWCRGPFLAFFLQRNAHTESLGTQSACGAFFFAHGFALALIAGSLYLCSNPRRLLFFRKTRTAPHAAFLLRGWGAVLCFYSAAARMRRRISSSAGQKSYCGISAGVIQRMSLCSSFFGVPARMNALNSVRCTSRSG